MRPQAARDDARDAPALVGERATLQVVRHAGVATDHPPPKGVVDAWFWRFADGCTRAQGILLLLTLVAAAVGAAAAYRQVASARASGDAAMEALAIQRRAAVLEDRPWLVFEQVRSPIGLPKAATNYQVEFRIQNVGKLPAIKVMSRTSVRLTVVGHEKLYDYGPPQTRLDSLTVIGPGDTKSTHVNILIPAQSADTLLSVANGASELYAYGHMTYESPDGTPGVLDYCSQFDPLTNSWQDCNDNNDVK